MSNLSLREIAQSQLDSTPVIDGQLIVCLDTGNAYRDTATAHVKIGSDLEVVSDLPLAPLAEKIYYLKPDKLYVFLGGNWTLLNDKTIDLDESIAKLPAGDSTSLNDDVEIITQDTDITQSHYYRRKLVVLWEYIKTKAQDFFAAKNHQHGKADITDFPTSMPASDVYPWAKAATKPSYTKAEVGLGKVDNTADADKTVKRATTAGTADSANSVAWGNVRDKPTTFPVEAHNHDDRYYTEAEMDGKLEKKSPTDHTHDLSELISGLSIGNSTTLNDSVQIITQDTNTANQKYYRRPLTVLWDYIKSKADSVYSAIGHNHKIQNLEEYTTRVYDATIVRQADTVLASPQDKDGIATFRKLDKNDVGLENVDNTADKNKNVATAGIATTGVRDYNNANNTIKIGWQGADLDAKTLAYVAGYTSDKKIHPASKDGVRSWLGLGDSAYKNTKSRSNKGSTDWTNNATDDAIVPTMSFMAYWDGAYNSNGASNLSYCDRGRFGTIVTKSSGDYLPVSGGTMSGQITKSTGGSWIGDRDRAAIKSGYVGDWAYGAVAGMATKNGYWTMGNYGGDESLIFNYSTDTNYRAGKNETSQVYLPAQAGAIITSATIGSQNVASATKASGVVDYGNTANTIQIGYGGAGATTSNLTHIAGYLSGGKQIKDVSKDVLKSWLGSLPASGGTASAANSLNPTVTFTGGNGNTTGYRLIGQVTFGKLSNYRCVMIVKSRHQGAGIVSVCMGNNTSTISQANAYSEIKYWGPQNSGTVIYGDAYKVYISADGKTGYLFWQYSDYSNTEAYVISSDFTISNGTWMTSIGSGYGSLWSTTQVNVANRTTYVKDIGNSSDTTFAYSKAGMNYVDYTWLAGWNGYELRAVNKNQFAIAGHSHSFINSVGAKNAQTGRNQIYGNVYSYNSNASAHTGMPTTYTSTIGFGQGASGTVEICGEWTGGKGLWSRALRDCCDNWYDWQRIYTDNYHPNADYATKANSADNASTSNGVKDYNDGNRTIKIGYAGSGLTADNLTHIAGYTDNGTKLKDVNKDVLKSWIGKVASATSADNGVTASGKTGAGIYYVRFGNGTQMCWGFYKESDHSGSTSFPVAFNNSQYSISLTVTVSSNNAPYITGRSTTSFSYARHGTSYNDVQWIAVGTWK